MNASNRSFVEHKQRNQERRDEWNDKKRIKESIELCSKALARGDISFLSVELRDELAPILLSYVDRDLYEYDNLLVDSDEWEWMALTDFLDEPDAYVGQLHSPTPSGASSLSSRLNGYQTGFESAKLTIRKAFESLVEIAEHEAIIKDELVNRVDAVILDTKIGEHIQGYEQDFGDGPTQAFSFQKGSLKTLFVGGTGSGKSTGAEQEAWSFYSKNFTPGRDYKLIDFTYSENGENWMYDLPQKQENLRRIREEMGADPDFGDETPQIEILAPLTPGLADEKLPYNTDSEEFVVKPYTAPASEISESLLVGLVENLLTHQQESTLRAAYQDVSKRSNWTLGDLKDEVLGRENLEAGVKEQTSRAIERLQNAGFIRDEDCEYRLDWGEILNDNTTITVFSISHVQDELARIMALAHAIVSLREFKLGRDHLYPQTVLMIRELFELTPHSKRESDDAIAAQLQKKMGSQTGKLMRRARHDGYHLICDTQKMGDLTKSVRELFNRYVVFDETKDTIKDIFSYTSNEKYNSFYRTITARRGEAGIVGEVGPAISSKQIEFISPVRYMPPPFHHYDDDGPPGWIVRTQINDAEELKRPSEVKDVNWDDAPVEQVKDPEPQEEKEYDPRVNPMLSFVQQAVKTGGEYTLKSDLQKAYNELRREAGREPLDFSTRSAQTKFGKFKDACESLYEYRPENKEREGGYAYASVQFTNRGAELLEAAQDREAMNDGSPIVE